MEDDFSLLKVDYCELGVGETYSRYKSSKFAYKFRRGPAPLTGHYGNSIYYRMISTFQERKMSLSCDKQFIRCARNIRNLPNSWDDIRAHGMTNYNWKRFGKKRKSWDK